MGFLSKSFIDVGIVLQRRYPYPRSGSTDNYRLGCYSDPRPANDIITRIIRCIEDDKIKLNVHKKYLEKNYDILIMKERLER